MANHIISLKVDSEAPLPKPPLGSANSSLKRDGVLERLKFILKLTVKNQELVVLTVELYSIILNGNCE